MQLAISKRGSFAIRAAVDLAAHPAELRKRREIAQDTGSCPRTLAGVLTRLRHAGLVDATPGRHGGYTLGRAPSTITILELIEAVEGDIVGKVCPLRNDPCDGSCNLHPAWKGAQESLVGRLGATTLAEVLGNGRAAA